MDIDELLKGPATTVSKVARVRPTRITPSASVWIGTQSGVSVDFTSVFRARQRNSLTTAQLREWRPVLHMFDAQFALKPLHTGSVAVAQQVHDIAC